MKKITLLLLICFAFSFNSHAQLFSEDFNPGTNWASEWEQYEGVDDGFDGKFGLWQNHLSSFSFQNTPSGPVQYEPDNYVISHAIDVTGATALNLSFWAGGQYVNFEDEIFTVYVSTGDMVADLNNPAITVSETHDLNLIGAADATLVNFNLDASALDGATTVYIAFRHFYDNLTLEILNIDDVVLTGTTLGIGDNTFAGFKLFVDTRHVLQLSSANKTLEGITIYNLLGQNILSNKLTSTKASIDLSALHSGIYIAQVSIDGTTNSFKIVKK